MSWQRWPGRTGNVDIDLQLAPGGATPVQGEPTLLAIIVRNLVNNAVQHSPAGASAVALTPVTDGSC